ncbi:hypothetical protein BRADI_5g09988v3, partial [Brachypodium distachyon]
GTGSQSPCALLRLPVPSRPGKLGRHLLRPLNPCLCHLLESPNMAPAVSLWIYFGLACCSLKLRGRSCQRCTEPRF